MLALLAASPSAYQQPPRCTRRAALVGLCGSLAARRAAHAAELDPEYPGTAVERMRSARERATSLTAAELSGDWASVVRPRLLWAAGLRDLREAQPGEGFTGHAFNDAIHVDATTMRQDASYNTNDGGVVKEIAQGNQLGPGILAASLPELGAGGSWSTCANGCRLSPPQDVAHVQYRSRIAFKLVWVPDDFSRFALVDDDGRLLAAGAPTGRLPALRERQANFELVAGSKYAVAASQLARSVIT